MITNNQKALIKRAQRQAGLDDSEYREALLLVTGCTSSTDPRLGDRSVDTVLDYFEAIYWRKVDLGELQHLCNGNAVFRERHYWATKNTRQETSRDRYTQTRLTTAISSLEQALAERGYGEHYVAAIREKTMHGAGDVRSLHAYQAALERTLKAKRRKEMEPF